ncbi:isoaspartyl peptidase/L-asparaginase-like isoform X1 [Rhodnius prolixus]|uniref:isoaspartyl peptidase/L-asparaginase-like isoform X1 n=1 Tax=Rhodnius prolixus TaxID=13249 RepID=UPI003D18B8EE
MKLYEYLWVVVLFCVSFIVLLCVISWHQINSMAPVTPVLVVHGGAGDIPDSRVQPKLDGVRKAARVGYKVLRESGNVLDAIEAAIHVMEDDDAFNAGKGSVLNLAGGIEMEALVTEGAHFNAGSVTLVKNISHPISLARMVMEKTPHTFLGGDGVEEFIQKMGIPRVPESSLITDAAKKALDEFKKRGGQPSETEIGIKGDVGTVGCVAVDNKGHVASGTSTGGITGKYKGRIGDTPLPGCGGYSDDLIGAVSTTGHGESILKYNLAHRVLSVMEQGTTAKYATNKACQDMTSRVGKTAGAITVSNKGEVGIGFTSKRMSWAYQIGDEIHYGIEHGQHLVEKA